MDKSVEAENPDCSGVFYQVSARRALLEIGVCDVDENQVFYLPLANQPFPHRFLHVKFVQRDGQEEYALGMVAC